MVPRRALCLAAAVVFAAGAALSHATDKKSDKTADEQPAGWNDAQMQQPATESLDLNAYNAIRD